MVAAIRHLYLRLHRDMPSGRCNTTGGVITSSTWPLPGQLAVQRGQLDPWLARMENSVKTITRKLARVALAVGSAVAIVTMSTVFAAASPSGDGCPGGSFCGWDGRDAHRSMIVQVDSLCRTHDIGNGGFGDRLTSFSNRTGKTVTLYNWQGTHWQPLATIADNQRGNLPTNADNRTDAVKVCP